MRVTSTLLSPFRVSTRFHLSNTTVNDNLVSVTINNNA